MIGKENNALEDWHGVRVNENGCVKCLDLDNMGDGTDTCIVDCSCLFEIKSDTLLGLSGNIPDLDLCDLEVLNLSEGDFDSIPNFSLLRNLKRLYLSNSTIDYPYLPDFSDLINLEWLTLNRNRYLKNIPDFCLPKISYPHFS